MKKKIFVFLAVSSLTLTGCSLSGTVKGLWNGFLEFIGIRKPAEEEKPKDEEQHGEEPKEEEKWTKTYSSNAYEHWYIDEDGQEVRASHEFKLKAHTDKTCTETDHDEYECEECGYTKIVNGHELAEHKYISTTTPSTCKEAGKVVFECTECGEKHETPLALDLNAHNFVSLGTVDGVTTFKCSICETTKTVIDHSSQVEAQVSTEALQQVDEIQLQNASIAFDESILENDLGKNVNISAESKKPEAVAEELSLPKEDQEKLAGKPIVDFSVKNEGSDEKISEFSGKVKVTIPYELQQGEDPEGIAIWYLSQDNEPEAIKAQYANGNVSFETDHFSYYAVVHLTPEESCAKFGHEMVKGSHLDSTCVAHGFEETICRRCHMSEREYLPLIPHSYECIERVDATKTQEGYVHYECKVCQDAYDVIIPKVVETGRGFYTNLIYSCMTPEWRTYSSVTEEGVNRTYDSYEGLDYDGEPFRYTSDGYTVYKGYSYNDYTRYQSYSSSNLAQLEIVRDIIDYIPQIYKDKVEELGSWLVEHYFTKEDVTEGYKLSVDYTKVAATYEAFRDQTLKNAIIATIGQSNFDEVYNFLINHYEDTVDELIAELGRRGYVIKALYDAITEVRVLHGEKREEIPSFDEFIKDVKSTKVIDLIEQLLPMIMGGPGQGSSGHVEPVEPVPDQQEPSGNGEVQEGEVKPDKSRGVLPETKADFKEMADEFLEGNLFDLVSSLAHMEKEDMIGVADDVVDMLKKGHAVMTLKTSKDGGFLSMEANVQDFVIEGLVNEEYAYSLMTKDFDKAGILKEIQKEVGKYELNKEKFTLDDSHFAWFAKPIEELYAKDYPGFKLEYKRNYNDTNSDALVSNIEIRSNESKWDEKEEQSVYKTGKLVLLVHQPSSYHYVMNPEGGWTREIDEYYYGDIIRNYNGLGSILKKDEIGLVQRSYRYIEDAYVEIHGESDVTYRSYVSEPQFEYLYRPSDDTMHITKEGGTYDYMSYGFYKPTLSSFEEWDAYYKQQYPDSKWIPSEEYAKHEDISNMIVLKVLNQLDGRVEFRTSYVDKGAGEDVFETYVLSKDMNDEALESVGSFRLYYGIRDGKLYGYTRAFYNYTPYYEYHSFSEDELDANFSDSIKFGNVTVSINAPKGTTACNRVVTWKVSAGGRSVISGSYRIHMRCHELEQYNYVDTPIDDCHFSRYQYYECLICHKRMNENTSIYDNHDYDYEHQVETVIFERTLTKAGLVKVERECKKCGDVYSDYRWSRPCEHYDYTYDEETHKFTCNLCGYSVETPDNNIPKFVYESFPSESEDMISFSMYCPRYSTWYLDSYYNFNLCAGYFDENHEFVALANGNESDLSWRWIESEVDDRYYEIARVLEFSKGAYESLVLEARESAPEGVEIVPTLAAVDRDSGTVFYYAIY